MAICAQCGKEIRDDIWTCGFCGAPVSRQASAPAQVGADEGSSGAYGAEGYNPYASQAAADPYGGAAAPGAYGAATTSYGAAPEGMTPYGTPVPSSRQSASGGLSSLTKLVLVGAGVAVVAIVLVWFFVLRGSDIGGDQFVGTWQAVDTKVGTLVVAKNNGAFEITLGSPDGQKAGPFKGDLQGDQLEWKLEAANGDDTNKAVAGLLKALLTGTLEDAHLMLTVRGADGHLIMSVSGKAAVGGEDVNVEAAEYVKGAGSV